MEEVVDVDKDSLTTSLKALQLALPSSTVSPYSYISISVIKQIWKSHINPTINSGKYRAGSGQQAVQYKHSL